MGSGTAESISLAPAPADDLWANSPPGSRTNASTPREVSWTDPEAVERRPHHSPAGAAEGAVAGPDLAGVIVTIIMNTSYSRLRSGSGVLLVSYRSLAAGH